MMSILDKINLFLNYTKVGNDQYGNSYYVSKKSKNLDVGQYKRTVMYNGIPEPSKIPPMWHAWLHYLTNNLPSIEDLERFSWQKGHVPNLTGTKLANYPSGHLMRGGDRSKVSSDYNAWNPRGEE